MWLSLLNLLRLQQWFQNRRARLRRMPALSPVKPVAGSTLAPLTSTAEGTTTACAPPQPRVFSPIVIQPRATSSASSSSSRARSSPPPKPITDDTDTAPTADDKSSLPLNESNTSALSTDSCEENHPQTRTEVKNKDEYKAMTITTVPADHPFCLLTHKSSNSKQQNKRKAVRDSPAVMFHEPPSKMLRREAPLQGPSPPGSRPARRRSSQGEGAVTTPRQQQPAPSVHTLNQLPIGYVPAWPGALPVPAPLPLPALSRHTAPIHSTATNISTAPKDDTDAPLDLSKKAQKSEKPKQDAEEEKKQEKKDLGVTKDILPSRLPPPATASAAAKNLPMFPPSPYYGFPFMGIPSHIHPSFSAPQPSGSVTAPFMVPMYPGAYSGMYGNPMDALYRQHSQAICSSGSQKPS